MNRVENFMSLPPSLRFRPVDFRPHGIMIERESRYFHPADGRGAD
jgi:hypothetical protein